MKEADWGECIAYNSSAKISPDKSRARSLVSTAHGRIDYLMAQKINELSARYIFEGYYASVLEMLHAFIILEGYKVENHICLGYYLRDILKNVSLFRLFDGCRFKRNSLVYLWGKNKF